MVTVITQIVTIFLPRASAIKVREAALVTGPRNKNTNAAPGENPFKISAIAIGIEDIHWKTNNNH